MSNRLKWEVFVSGQIPVVTIESNLKAGKTSSTRKIENFMTAVRRL